VVIPQVPNVHAATGVVCLEDITSANPANPCTSQTAPVFDGPFVTPNHQLTIGVFVEGSDPLNGWDITLLTNHNFLIPSAVDFTNTITGPVSSVSLIVLCLQGTPKSGSPTCLSTDTIDTLHYSAVGSKTLAVPTTGLLFTAIYNITGITPAGGIPIQYQSNCAGTVSVPGLCVTITNGTPSPDSETAQIAHFDNSGTPAPGVGTGASGVPYVTLSASTTNIGPIAAGATSSAVSLTVAAQNGWPNPFGTDSILFASSLPSSELPLVDPATGLTVTLSGTNPCAQAACAETVTFRASAAGNYYATIFANYAALSFSSTPGTGTNTLAAVVTINVVVVDYSISVSPTSYALPKGGPFALGVVTITSIGSFSSAVTLSTTLSPATGLTVTYAPNSVTPPPGGVVTSTMSFTAASTLASGSKFVMIVRAVGGGISHSFPATGSMTVLVNGFNVTASPTTVSFTSGGAGGSSTLTVKSIGGTTNGFAGAVSFTASTTPATGLSVNCPSATLTAGGTATSNCTFTSSAPANVYTVVITGRGGTNIVGTTNGVVSNSTTLTVTVTGGIANPSIATTIRDASNAAVTSVTVGTAVHDTAVITNGSASGVTGTVIYNFFANLACSGVPASSQTVTLGAGGVVPDSNANTPSPAGSYSYNATYSGDTNNNGATSPCEPLTVTKASPTIATTVSSTSIVVGTTASDSSTLTGGFSAGGTVTYSDFTNGACTAPGKIVSIVTVTGGVVPSSRAVTFNATGSYSFQTLYSGDANNNGATSPCEPLTVTKASPAITTTLSSNSARVGQTVTDSATLSSFFQAGGTVTYSVFTNGACTAPGTAASIVTVTNGVVPKSRAVLFNATGSFSFQGVYSGDTNNNGATSPCEPLAVSAGVAISTTLSSTTPLVGTTVTDSATLSGQSATAGGTVTYALFTNTACTAPGVTVSVVSVANGVVPNSRAVLFNSTGSFGFTAAYSGDANNNAATSSCEPLTVNPSGGATIATTLSSTSIIVGNTVTDSATLAGTTATAGGSVTYNDFANGVCTAPATVISIVGVTNSLVPNSRAVMFNSTGSFSFNAVYSGDANNGGATSTCEPLTVNKASPTITTTLSATSITVGGSVSDSSTLSNFYKASGTVTYEFFTGSTCTGTATAVGTPVTVTNGVVPNSASQAFNSAGSFGWNAVYSGDANNNGATSACEPLTFIMFSPTITTSLSATSISLGGSVTDSATLSNFFQAGGTVAYTLFSGGTCAAPGSVVSTVTVTNGIVPNSRAVIFNATGSFSFQAVYSGDTNNNGATSACEPLTVIVGAAIATTLSTTTPVVGTSVTDSASLSGQTSNAGGTVTYTDFANGVCIAPGTIVSIVTVTNGVVPDSRPVLFNSTGSFSFMAAYSGDANNNAATSPCESLTVVKASPTITTTLSSSTITVGSSVTDSATMANFFKAGGTVTYEFFTGSTCTGTATAVGTPVSVTNGVVPDSASQTFSTFGSFSWNGIYSGDANNNGATSPCEPLTVAGQRSLSTTLSATTITVGGSVTDSATLNGTTTNASGTVTYTDFANSGCTSPGTTVSVVTVTNGAVPASRAVAFNSTGSFSFQATYSGDANNTPLTSACEPLTVNKTTPTITTLLSSTSITVGNAVSDSATLTGGFQAGGSVTYSVFSNDACTAPGTVPSIVIVTSGVVPDSRLVIFNGTGSFSFQGAYSGDSNNDGATSPCEALTVAGVLTITSALSSTTITVGGSVTDSAVLSGQTATASGTVTYLDFASGTCAGIGTFVSVVTVTNGVVPNSRVVTFNSTGAFGFQASYSGDASNSAATSLCEPLTVTMASPTITTSLSAASVLVGQSATDLATLAGFYKAEGTVTYNVFANGSCVSPGTAVSIVTVVNGVVPASRAVTFNATGSYSFQATYSGDSNNNGAASVCEPLTVVPVIPPPLHSTMTVVTCTMGSVLVNTLTSCTARVIDNSTSPTVPTGMVTFTTNSTGIFSPASATCTLAAGNAPNMAKCSVTYTPSATGKHRITGSYGGDSSHAKSIGAFLVNVRPQPGGSVLLTFNGFDLDDFDNGVGQLDVLVNGQLVADIPAGLNHLTGTGDYKPYQGVAVDFGPFDITSLLVTGQNTIVFKDSTSFDHFGVVRNVRIVQGNTILLHVSHARGVSPDSSFSYTFSNPPLTLNSFTNSGATVSNQVLTFAVTYTGGTGPFVCIFRFGDGESRSVSSVGSSCSVTHDYASPGSFSAAIKVKGASTSDKVSAGLPVTVS